MPDVLISTLMAPAFQLAEAAAQARMQATQNSHIIALSKVPVRFSTIDQTALAEVRASWKGCRHPWLSVHQYLPHEPLWFDVALWSGQTLCGLAVGHQAKYVVPDTLDITLLEGAPQGHPLKGATRFYLGEAGAMLAKLIPNITRVRLRNPVNQTVTALYAAAGFDENVDPPHCVRDV